MKSAVRHGKGGPTSASLSQGSRHKGGSTWTEVSRVNKPLLSGQVKEGDEMAG